MAPGPRLLLALALLLLPPPASPGAPPEAAHAPGAPPAETGEVLLALAERDLKLAAQTADGDAALARIVKAQGLAARALTALDGTRAAARASRVAARAARMAEEAGPPARPAETPRVHADLPAHVAVLASGAVPVSAHVADDRRWRHFAAPFAETWAHVGAAAAASDAADVAAAPSRFGIQTTPVLTVVTREASLGVFASATQAAGGGGTDPQEAVPAAAPASRSEPPPLPHNAASFFHETAANAAQFALAAHRPAPGPAGLPVAAGLWYTSAALASLVRAPPNEAAAGVAYVGVTSLEPSSGVRAFALELNDEPLLPVEYTAAVSDGAGWQTWPIGALRTAFFYLHAGSRTRGRIEVAGVMPCPGAGLDGFGDDAAPPIVLANCDAPPTSAQHLDRTVWGEAHAPGADYERIRGLTCVEEVTRRSARRRTSPEEVAAEVVARINLAACLRQAAARGGPPPEVLYVGVLNACPVDGEFHVRLGTAPAPAAGAPSAPASSSPASRPPPAASPPFAALPFAATLACAFAFVAFLVRHHVRLR